MTLLTKLLNGRLAEKDAEIARLRAALETADKIASAAHDAMWAMNFDKTRARMAEIDYLTQLRMQASDEIHNLHAVVRGALAESLLTEDWGDRWDELPDAPPLVPRKDG
jgi:hypothetical protein